jgi:hypothetical protein
MVNIVEMFFFFSPKVSSSYIKLYLYKLCIFEVVFCSFKLLSQYNPFGEKV